MKNNKRKTNYTVNKPMYIVHIPTYISTITNVHIRLTIYVNCD